MDPPDQLPPSESSPLLQNSPSKKKSSSSLDSTSDFDLEAGSVFTDTSQAALTKSALILATGLDGERLPYNDYTTIDWLHDLTKDSLRLRTLRDSPGIRYRLLTVADKATGWIAAAIIGALTACVAFLVDIGVATVADWKAGYCSTNYLAGKEMCCTKENLVGVARARMNPWHRAQSSGSFKTFGSGEICHDWVNWTENYSHSYIIYVAMALAFGIISASVTALTKSHLPAAAPGTGDRFSAKSIPDSESDAAGDLSRVSTKSDFPKPTGKVMYMAAGSGIPEIKTVLSGFVIPHFLTFKVLVVKAVGSVFAVSTGMCLGKEGPCVHISTCVANLVAKLFSKYRNNDRKMREILSAGCASGLSVAFGAPIGGVLFSYEEISTYFPRKVLWRAFLCSLCAAATLKELNPTGTGKLVLFETNYGTTYSPSDYLIFVLLGIAGGVFGGTFCRWNFLWSRHFRKFQIIKNHPVFETALITLATAVLQFPHQMTRETGDIIIKNLLVDCRGEATADAWVCKHENGGGPSAAYIGWLAYGTLIKLVLTTITFGVKVPSGIIIPALDAGAFFGRLVAQFTAPGLSPGIFAMVGAVAFLAGVSRMTISLAIIMLELTGELEYVVPYMVGILVAKWVADALEPEGVYDLAQNVLGHPFLDGDHAVKIAQRSGSLVEELVPPKSTMNQITVEVPLNGYVSAEMLSEKLEKLKRRGLMDAGLVLVRDGILQGYLSQTELDGGLMRIEESEEEGLHGAAGPGLIKVLSEDGRGDNRVDLVNFVNKTPLTISSAAPMEFAAEMFSKLGLRYLCVLEEGSGKLCGVIIKKRLLNWLHKHKKYD